MSTAEHLKNIYQGIDTKRSPSQVDLANGSREMLDPKKVDAILENMARGLQIGSLPGTAFLTTEERVQKIAEGSLNKSIDDLGLEAVIRLHPDCGQRMLEGCLYSLFMGGPIDVAVINKTGSIQHIIFAGAHKIQPPF